jgi:hypothetical protein
MNLDKFNTENFTKLESKLNKMLQTKWFYGILIISIILYIQIIKINVDPRLHKFLNSNLFRLFAFSIIAYMCTQNFTISLILSLGFIVLIIVLQNQKLVENFFHHKNSVVNIDFIKNTPMKQPGILGMNRCDSVNTNALPSFTNTECLAYADEANEYKLN